MLDEVASDDYVYEGVGHGALQRQQFPELVSAMRGAFPDLRNTLEEQVAEGATVVTRGMTAGTQRAHWGRLCPLAELSEYHG